MAFLKSNFFFLFDFFCDVNFYSWIHIWKNPSQSEGIGRVIEMLELFLKLKQTQTESWSVGGFARKRQRSRFEICITAPFSLLRAGTYISLCVVTIMAIEPQSRSRYSAQHFTQRAKYEQNKLTLCHIIAAVALTKNGDDVIFC